MRQSRLLRRWAPLAVLFATAAVLLAAPAEAGARTYLPDCAFGLHVKPRSITVFCADAGVTVNRIHWKRWGSRSAFGWSTHLYQNDCTPNCADGHFHRYRAHVKPWRARTCPANGRRVFTRLTIRYWHRGHRSHRFTQHVACRLRPLPG